MKITRLLLLNFLLISSLPLTALEEVIVLGREAGWGRLRHEGTMLAGRGFRGYSDILLRDAAYERDAQTELLFHFDAPPRPPALVSRVSAEPGGVLWETEPKYRVFPENIGAESDIRVFGTGSALFSPSTSRIRIEPQPGSLFYPGSDWRDFTIEFWLYPAETESRQEILGWEGTTLPGEWGSVPRRQELSCRLGGNRLSWSFGNIFRPQGLEAFPLELAGSRELLPRRWHHHMVRFDSATGLLEYLVDGVLEDYAYANHQNREADTVFLPFLGSAGPKALSIGRGLSGFLDELRISSGIRSQGPPKRYEGREGTVLFAPQDLSYGRSRLVSIESSREIPEDADIFFYYQLSGPDSPGERRADDPNWIPFEPGDIFSPDTRGRYLHLMAALYPDGKERQSPVLSDISITFEPDLPPPPPSGLRAEAGNGSVRLSWDPVPDPDLEGYRIFYGTAPGRYFGDGSTQGPSPVDAGKDREFVISGLTNGRLYYFVVAAYDASQTPYQTLFSREVSARPRPLEPGFDGGAE
jgi:Concanavalin A-like lectin/glucanases superfamily/Fibronectin type III domain